MKAYHSAFGAIGTFLKCKLCVCVYTYIYYCYPVPENNLFSTTTLKNCILICLNVRMYALMYMAMLHLCSRKNVSDKNYFITDHFCHFLILHFKCGNLQCFS